MRKMYLIFVVGNIYYCIVLMHWPSLNKNTIRVGVLAMVGMGISDFVCRIILFCGSRYGFEVP